MRSPQETGLYQCPFCGNQIMFIGYDDRGYPGPEQCACDKTVCTGVVTLTQRFAVFDTAILYGPFQGGGPGAVIDAYTRIQCGVCGKFIWPLNRRASTD